MPYCANTQKLTHINQYFYILQQLEKYAENLQKCHERQLAAEQQKRSETEAMIDEIHENMQYAKQSIQVYKQQLI